MRRFLTTLAIAILLRPAVAAPQAAHPGKSKPPDLNKVHKQQWKALNQQQRAMKKMMAQHGMSSEERRSIEHAMKVERQTLRKQQQSESRRIKESGKSASQSHTTVLNHLP